MTAPENTAAAGPMSQLMASMNIEGQEAEGQRQLVESDVLPTEVSDDDRAEMERLGFSFGGPVDGDDLFMHAELPAGWSRKATDHSLWSGIIDERGLERVAVFYKAAFYDRKAFMRTTDVGAAAVSIHVYDATPIPWALFTAAEREAAIAALITAVERYSDTDRYGDYHARAAAALAEASAT